MWEVEKGEITMKAIKVRLLMVGGFELDYYMEKEDYDQFKSNLSDSEIGTCSRFHNTSRLKKWEDKTDVVTVVCKHVVACYIIANSITVD